MAKSAGLLDVWAPYGVAQNRPEYELLREVSHWSSAAIKKDKELREDDVRPTKQLSVFSDLLKLVSFAPYTKADRTGITRSAHVEEPSSAQTARRQALD